MADSDSDDDQPCRLLIDIFLHVSNKCIYSTKHFMSNAKESFTDTVRTVMTEYVSSKSSDLVIVGGGGVDDDPIKVEVRGLMARIMTVTCVGVDRMNLLKFLQQSSTITTKQLDSKSCPIFERGVNINIAPAKEKPPPIVGEARKKLPSAIERLMGNSEPSNIQYLQWEEVNKNTFDIQVRKGLYLLAEREEVGFFNISQRECLETNLYDLSNVLCFVEKQWVKLLRAPFPSIPDGDYSGNLLLEVVGNCCRPKPSDERLTLKDLSTHCGTLANMSWYPFRKSKRLKQSLESFEAEITHLYQLLIAKKKQMQDLTPSIFDSANSRRSNVPSSFESVEGVIALKDNEFYAPIEASVCKANNKKKQGARSRLEACRDISVDKWTTKLKYSRDYQWYFLSDEEMGMTKDALGDSVHQLESQERAVYRFKFCEAIRKGLDGIHINIFGRLRQGMNNPSCIFIWKCPLVYGPDHIGRVQATIQECRDAMPKLMSAELAKHFNNIIMHISNVPAKVRTALKNYLFLGDTKPKGAIAEEYCQFVTDMAAGLPIDPSFILDGRTFNSCGGKGTGYTQFEHFFEECRAIMYPSSTTDERRHTDNIHASEVLSISNLVKRATDNLQAKVSKGEYDALPPVPSTEWVRLQFSPNNDYVERSSKFLGRLAIKRAIQTRTLRKEHEDQHWVNAITRYHLEWVIELKLTGANVEFFGGDDKAKIPVGDKVAVSTGVRPNSTRSSIVAEGAEVCLKAMDHDFYLGCLVPSVLLRCNVPQDMSGSFFIGDEEKGIGQIFVTLRDAIFDGSKIFDHIAQMIDTFVKKDIAPAVLLFQADGGVDRSIKRLVVKLAFIALFKYLNLDHLAVLRCAPNGSAYDKIERAMSPLNGALVNVATKRKEMKEFAEKAVRSCGSMSDVRAKEEGLEKTRRKAIERVAHLKQMEANRGVRSVLETCFNDLIHFFEYDLSDADNAIDAMLACWGIKVDAINEAGAVSGMMETDDGVVYSRSTTLLESVATAQLEQAEELASQDFRAEWDASIGVPIKKISERIGELTLSGRPVVVTDRVGPTIEQRLHNILRGMDDNYTPNLTKAEDWKKIPVISAWMDRHWTGTPYSFSIRKCNDTSCCGPFKTPIANRSLAMQVQPAPRIDPNRPGHFLCRDDALQLHGSGANASTNLTDLPSMNNDTKKASAEKKAKIDRDVRVAKDLNLRSWDQKKVKGFVVCYNCDKNRCYFSQSNDERYKNARDQLLKKLDSVSSRYSCGDLLFEDDHPVSQVIGQRQAITCESKIEKAYYNSEERGLITPVVCIHCGEGGGEDFVLGQTKLQELNKTGGRTCYPICIVCLEAGKKVEVYPKKKTKQSQRKRKEDAANKAAKKTAKKTKKK